MFDAQKLGSPVDHRQVKVGEVALDGRAFLAPMAGVTDFTMRVIAERHGASVTVSEMITGRGIYAVIEKQPIGFAQVIDERAQPLAPFKSPLEMCATSKLPPGMPKRAELTGSI